MPSKELLIVWEITFSFFFLAVKLHKNDSAVKFRITNYHMCKSADDILYAVRQISLIQCVEKCASQSNCSAVSYRRRHKLCELHSTFHENFVGNAFIKGPCVFINRSDIFTKQHHVDYNQSASEESCNTKYCDRTFCLTLKLDLGILLGNMNSVGSRVKYTCNRYFVETAGMTHSTCQSNGSWTHDPECSARFLYVGCFEDKQQRILSETEMESNFLTTETCVNYCFALQYMYALTEFKSQCFCGNTLRNYPKKDDGECNMSCVGDQSETCGGWWRGSLYRGIL